MKNRRW